MPSRSITLIAFAAAVASAHHAAAADPPMFRLVVPGFVVRELPVRLTSLNNIEYAPDGRLFAGGYDGRFHMLSDRDGDGLEETVDTLLNDTSANYPLGIAVRDGCPWFVLSDEVIRFVDTDGDSIPETRETVVKGFDDPSLAGLPYLHRRRVDSSLGLALAADGSIYVTMGNAGFSNPYWHDNVAAESTREATGPGQPQYSPAKRRGCLLRIHPDGRIEQLVSGLRYVMSLQFNASGDLFASDQEGATWCPNGNPFDELLHLEPERHYGFPPHHPRWLPDVIDEPSVYDYGPQHQSTCGFRFNGPAPGRGRLGPDWWAGDVLMTGASRGKLWRTTLARTAAGYTAISQLLACTNLLPVDVAVSPTGDVVICCHSGKPDWGNGPTGAGHLFKISAAAATPRPVLTLAASPEETWVVYDAPLDESIWRNAASRIRIDAGRFVSAADRLESIRPSYAVVAMQQQQRFSPVAREVDLQEDRTLLTVRTDPRTEAVTHALALPDGSDVDHDLSGATAAWRAAGVDAAAWRGPVPHLDMAAIRQFTHGSPVHDRLFRSLATPGTLRLTCRLDLWRMLIPAVQPGARLDYEPADERVTITFRSDAPLTITTAAGRLRQVDDHTVHLVVDGPAENAWPLVEVSVATPVTRLDVAFTTDRDERHRPLPARRILQPFARPAPPLVESRIISELARGDYEAGRALFVGKAACSTCHQFRGVGHRVGPDLGNTPQRDYAGVLRDVTQPDAVINPDAVGYVVLTTDGRVFSGVRISESPDALTLAMPGGRTETIRQADIDQVEPMQTSLMPATIRQLLSESELRDLMTYLMSEPPDVSGPAPGRSPGRSK